MRALLSVPLIGLIALAVAGLTPAAHAAPLDDLAVDFAKLQLEVGVHDPGYIDAYYGPAEWKTEAEARKRTPAAVNADVEALIARLEAAPTNGLSPLEARRRAFLIAHLRAGRARLNMAGGARLPFRDEAEVVLGWRPDLKPLSSYDPILAKLETIVPGEGDLAERLDAFRSAYVIPKDKLDVVMRAGIAECRRRTAEHVALPAGESFTLEFVTGKSWSGYNWYQGGSKSLIQINTDLPINIDRAVDLGCHEGYPGHHMHNASLERALVNGRGWREIAVFPLYGPTAFIAEGVGNYGVELAFPGKEQLKFEQAVLYPLAGLDPKTAPAYDVLRDAVRGLANSRATISADYLDGKIDRVTAVELIRKYNLVSRARAEQLVKFTDEYRTYVINYGLGQDAVKAYVERVAQTPAERWKAFEALISEPTLPSDLK